MKNLKPHDASYFHKLALRNNRGHHILGKLLSQWIENTIKGLAG